jgi:hypothetical protein
MSRKRYTRDDFLYDETSVRGQQLAVKYRRLMIDDMVSRKNNGQPLTEEQKGLVDGTYGPERKLPILADAPSANVPPTICWKVTVTSFRDDYRHDGHDWSSEYDSGLFTTRDEANTFLRQTLIGLIEETSQEGEHCDLKNYPMTFTTEGYLQRNYRMDLETVEAIATTMTKGTYVPRTFKWTIQECRLPTALATQDEEEMDSDASEPPEDGEDTSDSDSEHEISHQELTDLLSDAKPA